MEKCGRARQATDGNILRRIASWITKATDTHSEYVILITFSRQIWLRESSTMLRYMYIACLSNLTITDDVVSSYYPFSMCLYLWFVIGCIFFCFLFFLCNWPNASSASSIIRKNGIELLVRLISIEIAVMVVTVASS